MDRRLRATLAACLVFLFGCALYFVQPFTGSFLLVAAFAAVLAAPVFLAVLGPRTN